MITASQYESLLPFRDEIFKTVEIGQTITLSQKPQPIMRKIWIDLGQVPKGYCSGCVMDLYRDFYNLIKTYENGKAS